VKIESIMSRRLVKVKRADSIKDVVKTMAEKKVGGVVVVDRKVPVGIFTKSDLIASLLGGVDLNKTPVEQAMLYPVHPVGPSERIIRTVKRMELYNLLRFIVVSSDGRLAGIVTDLDIVRRYALSALSYKTALSAAAVHGITATPATPLKKIARMMLDEQRSCAAVCRNGKPVGIINETLLVKLAARFKDPLKFRAKEKMIKGYCSASPDDSLRENVLNMIKKDMRNIILVDEDGKYAGMVSLGDIVTFIIASKL